MTFQTFPLSNAPAYLIRVLNQKWPDGNLARNGIHYDSDDVTLTTNYTSGTITYTVLDYFGATVKTGSVTSAVVNLGSFDFGWYRIRFHGASSDAVWGDSYGSDMFIVCPRTSNLPDLPVSTFNVFNWKPNGYGRTDAQVDAGGGQGSPTDIIMRATAGMGTGRMEYNAPLDADDLYSEVPGYANLQNQLDYTNRVLRKWWLSPQTGDPGVADPVRPRRAWLAFDVQTWDWFLCSNTTGPVYIYWLTALVKDVSIDGSKVFLTVTNGTSSGYKVTVYYPNASTVVETYDNISTTDNVETLMAGSNYVVVFGHDAGMEPVLVTTPTAIGSKRGRNISTIVSVLYPLGITHYEGPYNEWPAGNSAAHLMKLFQGFVHAGHPDAKAIGPCFVDITNETRWRAFLNAGGGNYVDAPSFHDYNTNVQGDINEGRANIETLLSWFDEYGVDYSEMWQTEATHSKIADLFAVAHPRRARITMIKTLMWEQYGVPMEKNPYWYDLNHGFWSYNSSAWTGFYSPNPQVGLMRTLADEVFGKNFHHAVDFGSVPANQMFLGNVYGDAVAGSTMALICASYMADSTVTLQIVGTTDPIQVVDSWGNVTSVAQSSGRITVDVLDIPTYVRLPAGVNAYVWSVRDWGNTPAPSVSATASVATLGGVAAGGIADDRFMTLYSGGTSSPGITHSASVLPDAAVVKFLADKSVERVIVWSGPCWQAMPGLLDFDVDTLDADGVTWTTRATVTRTATSDWWGCAVWGTQRETFWNEQWIEDVKLPSPVTTKGIRVYVRAASYGGEPDADMITFTGLQLSANGMEVPQLAIQEIAVVSPTPFSTPSPWTTEALAHSPIAWWRQGEASGTVMTDSSGNALHGTYTNVTLGADGLITDGNTAAVYGGSGTARAVVPHNSLLNVGDVFTFAFWFETSTFAGGSANKPILSKGAFAPAVSISSGSVVLSQATVGNICTSTSTISTNSRAFVAVTKNGADVHLYINAIDVTGTVTNRTTTNTSSAFGIGDPTVNMDCTLDEVMVWGTALSAQNVLDLYLSGTAPLTPTNESTPLVAA